MSKRFSILLVFLTIVSGLIGGVISGRIFTPKVAIAEEAKQSKILTVEGLRVVDKDGKLLVQLGKNDELNRYGLFIYDHSLIRTIMSVDDEIGGYVLVSGKDGIAIMNIEETGGNVSVYGKNDESAAGMCVNKNGGGAVIVYGKKHELNVVLGSFGEGETGGNVPHVIVYGKDGKGGAMMKGGDSGGVVSVESDTGNVGAVMGVDETGGTIIVYGKEAKGGALMSVNEFGGIVDVLSKSGGGKAIASMQVSESGNGVIKLFDKNGNKLK